MRATNTSISIGAGVETIRPIAHPGRTRRRIGPDAGRALEKLGHAIDYLTDEYVKAGRRFRTDDPQLEAIQILMNLNRQVYFECPLLPALAERVKTWLRTRLT